MNGYINPGGKVLRQFDRLSAWSKHLLFPPVGIEIDLTNRCNLGCEFCHFAYTHTRGPLARKGDDRYADMGDEMDWKLLEKIIPELKENGVESITFTGGGEPTLYPMFKEAIELAADFEMPFGLYTNGTLITPELGESIREKAEWVVVSIDEPYHDQYRAIKRVDRFNEAVNGVRNLVGGKAIVGASFLVGRYHEIADLRRMYEVGYGSGANYVEYRPQVIFDENNPSVANEDTSWVEKIIEHLEFLKEFHGKADARIEQFRLYRNYYRNYGACYGILFTGIITPNGSMWKCVNRRGFKDSEIGNLAKESFAEIWARQKPQTDFSMCRVLCRADVINRTLWDLSRPIPHEDFI